MTRKQFFRRIIHCVAVLSAGLGFALHAAPGAPPGLLNEANPRVQEMMAVQRAVTSGLMTVDGILGTAVGQNGAGENVLLVFIDERGKNPGEVERSLPPANKGVGVSGRLTERAGALKRLISG